MSNAATDATQLGPVVIGPQPADLGSAEGNSWLALQNASLAEREADRGDMTHAYEQIRKAKAQAYKIAGNQGLMDSTLAQIDQANAYCAAKEGSATANQAAAVTSDSNYQAGQVLNDGALKVQLDDNSDLKAALDAKDAGLSPDIAYNQAYLARKAQGATKQVTEAGANLVGGAVGGVAKGLLSSAIFGSGGWLVGVGVLAVVVVVGYAWFQARTLRAVAGAK